MIEQHSFENNSIGHLFALCIRNLYIELCAIFEDVYIESQRLSRAEQHVRFETKMYALLDHDAASSRKLRNDLFGPLQSANGHKGVSDFTASKLYLSCTLDVVERMFTKTVVEKLNAFNV